MLNTPSSAHADTAPLADPGTQRTVIDVSVASGVNPGSSDYVDSSGQFADYSVLELSSNTPSTSRVADMAWGPRQARCRQRRGRVHHFPREGE